MKQGFALWRGAALGVLCLFLSVATCLAGEVRVVAIDQVDSHGKHVWSTGLGITAPDDQTIVFQLIQPNAAFESVLLNFRNFILPQAAVLAAAPKVFTLDNKGIWALPFWQSPTIGEGPYIWDKTITLASNDVNQVDNGYYTTQDLNFTSLK